MTWAKVSRTWKETTARHWPGLEAFLDTTGQGIKFSPPEELTLDGRLLEQEEYDRAGEVFEAFTSALDAAAVLHWSIEEIFVLDFRAMTKEEGHRLQQAYATLPGWIGAAGAQSEVPQWFGPVHDTAPWLSASVEPPGLHVFGTLPLALWDPWKHRFLEATRALPYRSMAW